MRKNLIQLVMVACLFTGLLSGCGKSEETASTEKRKLKIVCTTFPQYDWVREILGDKVEQADITLLLNNGGDLHNYQPSAKDIAKIAASDVFIYVGGESDEWVKSALAEATNENMEVINMMESLGDVVRSEEIVEGMEASHDHEESSKDIEAEHDHDEAKEEHEQEAEHEHDEEEYDEHVWLSLQNANEICKTITESLKKLDSENSEAYDTNLAAYQEKLAALDQGYQSVINNAKGKTLLFGDRFPFRYLVDDYGLDYYAAFPGCSAETEASFETIAILAEKTDSLGLKSICVTESSDQSIAKTIINNTNEKNQNILVLNSLQAVTATDIENKMTYLSVMESNLEVLKQLLE